MEGRRGTNFSVACQLMGAGEHFNDDGDRLIRRDTYNYSPHELPREHMLTKVVELGLRRPPRSTLSLV